MAACSRIIYSITPAPVARLRFWGDGAKVTNCQFVDWLEMDDCLDSFLNPCLGAVSKLFQTATLVFPPSRGVKPR